MKNKNRNYYTQNVNARLKSRPSKSTKLRTETQNREDGFDVAMTTDSRTNSTNLFIDFDGGAINGGETVRLDGHRARTLFRLLSKHYRYTDKSLGDSSGW